MEMENPVWRPLTEEAERRRYFVMISNLCLLAQHKKAPSLVEGFPYIKHFSLISSTNDKE